MSHRFHSKGRSHFAQPMAPHRRQHIHGAVLPMARRRVRLLDLWTARFGLAFSALSLGYFVFALVWRHA